MEQHFYQLGGEGSPLMGLCRGYGHKCAPLAQDLFRERAVNGRIEMILGILKTGASYLLLPATPDLRIGVSQIRGHRFPASRYESISPITFDSAYALADILQALVPKKNAHDNSGRDLSAANKPYTLESTDGIPRSMFEHCRILYRALETPRELNQRALCLDVDTVSRLQALKIYALTVTFWQNTKETVLDVGYTGCAVGTTEPQSTHHLNVLNNMTYNPNQRAPFAYGETEVLERTIVDQRVIDLLSSRSGPLLLLVWGQPTLEYLNACGLSTVDWKSGLKDLFDYSSRRPSYRASPADVFVVDLKVLCERVFRTSQTVKTLSIAASKLGISMPPVGDRLPHQCAGNDARRLLEMWCILAEGNAIDEQHKYWNGRPAAAPVAPAPIAAPAEEDDDDDDEERDPLLPPRASAVVAPPPEAQGGGGMSDEESDFGDSDDEY